MIKALIVLLENIYCKIDNIYSINYKQWKDDRVYCNFYKSLKQKKNQEKYALWKNTYLL